MSMKTPLFDKKRLLHCVRFLLCLCLFFAVSAGSAKACTMIYVGGDYTEDGSAYYGRSADFYWSYQNDLAYVSPHGLHKAGETYLGCDGFPYTFTHDSYTYTAMRIDNLVGPGNPTGQCPWCEETHPHTPYEENGTNEKGVSVSANVSLVENPDLWPDDDSTLYDTGLWESEQTTILLGEAGTAREGLELLMDLYDTIGAAEDSGIFIADQKERWYIESYMGHQYIAVRLNDSMITLNPNFGIIGLVDLADTENVIASPGVIDFAKQAGTYVGLQIGTDADGNPIYKDNTIHFRASYAWLMKDWRMENGLQYLLGEENPLPEIDDLGDAYTISNLRDGEIVPLYTNIRTNRVLTTKDIIDFYKVNGIANGRNMHWHVFQMLPDRPMETATVEWLGMGNGRYSAAIPYYSAITKDFYDAYKVGGLGADEPMPDGWESSFYWSDITLFDFFDLFDEDQELEDKQEMVRNKIEEMQQKCYRQFKEMESKADGITPESATAWSAALAKEAHELSVKLYYHVAEGRHDPVLVGAEEAKPGKPGCTGDTVCSICQEVLEQGEVTYVAHTISFHPGDGQGNMEPVTLSDMSTYTLPDCAFASPEGKIFKAWSIDGKEYAAGAEITVLKDLDIYAKWTENTTDDDPPTPPSKPDPVTPDPAPDEPVTWENPYSDVNETNWYYAAVRFANENGLFYGTSDTAFSPNDDMTRGMLATVLYRLAKEPAATADGLFSDVVDGKYYTEAIAWAAENKIVAGYGNNRFGPEDSITREQLATILWRYAGSPESAGSLDKYLDRKKASSYAIPALEWAVEQGIVSGKGNGILDPTGKAARAEVAAMLMRYCEAF